MYWKTIWIPQILGAVFGGVFVFRLGRSKTPEILLHTMEEFTGMIRESKGYTGWAEKTERKLIRNGAKYEDTERLTRSAIESSKEDWDSYETSWDFKRNPLV